MAINVANKKRKFEVALRKDGQGAQSNPIVVDSSEDEDSKEFVKKQISLDKESSMAIVECVICLEIMNRPVV